jgi:hypothetical protein
VDPNATASVLRAGGDEILLRRLLGHGLYVEVRCAAHVAQYRPELRAFVSEAGGLLQADRICTISNAEIEDCQWPGPPRRGDIVILLNEGSRTTTVQDVAPANINGEIVRYDLAVRGSN